MGDRVLYKTESLTAAYEELGALIRTLEDVADGLDRVNTSAQWWGQVSVRVSGSSSNARSAVKTLRSQVKRTADTVSDIRSGVVKTRAAFDAADSKIVRLADGVSQGSGHEWGYANGAPYMVRNVSVSIETEPYSRWDQFQKEFSDRFGWNEALAGAGYIGTIYDFVQDIKNGKSWQDFARTGVDITQFIQGATKTWSNYKRIGRAVGAQKAQAWWFKNVTGLRPLGRASSAKKFSTRFANNLTNKTSPFNAQLKEILGDFAGKNGAGRAAVAWAGIAVDGVLNWSENREEQRQSGGTMSDARVVAETVTETAVGAAVSYGAGIVVGAAVTAALGTVAAPGVVVVGLTGLAVAGINAGVQALTGKSVTEFVSDGILDTMESVGNAIGNGIQSVGETLGNWFGKLSWA